jgi:hypothetical protein
VPCRRGQRRRSLSQHHLQTTEPDRELSARFFRNIDLNREPTNTTATICAIDSFEFAGKNVGRANAESVRLSLRDELGNTVAEAKWIGDLAPGSPFQAFERITLNPPGPLSGIEVWVTYSDADGPKEERLTDLTDLLPRT